MADIINSESFTEAIIQAASDRYDIEKTGQIITLLFSVAPESLSDKQVLQLKRKTNTTVNRHTILIATVESKDHFNEARRWAAAVRDELPDPGLSDLYLISALKEGELPIENCTSIEANEQYCRKYFLRPQETTSELIERTFLFPLSNEISSENLADPLHKALNETKTGSPWFTAEQQEHWRFALLSGKTGADLVEYLFNDTETVNPEENEIPGEANDQ